MHILILSAIMAVGSCTTLRSSDAILITDIFPHTTPITTTSTVKSTTWSFLNQETCECVPRHLCSSLDYEKWLTSMEELGYRGENMCSHYLETCCDKENIITKKPQPDPTKVKGCGYRNPQDIGNNFVIQSYETQFDEFPWVVALLDANNSTYAGAGVLISPDVVMTGAHIASKYAPGRLKIRAGEWDTQTTSEIYEHQEREVKEIHIHSNYSKQNLKNNIALLRLDRPLELTEHINVICMPEQDEVFDSHKNCIANGWGKDVFGSDSQYSVILKKQELDMIPHDECERSLKKTRLSQRFKLHESFVCANKDDRDSCRGDGGGPLACPIGNDQYKLTGLVAWGIGCGPLIPAVYTNVPMFRQWVDEKMKEWGLQIAQN